MRPYLRYKPGTKCVLAFGTGAQTRVAMAYPPERYRILRGRKALREAGGAVRFFDGLCVAVLPATLDRDLRALARLADRKQRQRMLRRLLGPDAVGAMLRLLRHNPNRRAVLLPGPAGVGKAHLAAAFGREVIVAGCTVLFVPPATLVAALVQARAGERLRQELAHFASPKLPIAGEPGCLSLGPGATHLFFQLVSRRCGRTAPPITSDRTAGEWGTIFGDPAAATAILDRMLHHCHVVTLRAASPRLCEKHRSGLRTGGRSDARNRNSPTRNEGGQLIMTQRSHFLMPFDDRVASVCARQLRPWRVSASG